MDQAGQLVDERHLRHTEMADYLAAHVPPATYAVLKATRNWPCMNDLVKAHLARLNYLPTVYTAPPAVRDLRLATRHREWLTRQRTQAKNRIQAVLARYALQAPVTDLFGRQGRRYLLVNMLLRGSARRPNASWWKIWT